MPLGTEIIGEWWTDPIRIYVSRHPETQFGQMTGH